VSGLTGSFGVAGDRDGEGLFEFSPVAGARETPGGVKPPVDKTFRVFDPDQILLLPPSLDEWLPGDHLARFIADLVDEHLDLSRIRAAYTQTRGGPPYDPRLMVRLLLYGYCTGVRSSRAIERACTDVVAFRWLACGAGPDFRAIARFRKRHLSALGHLFVQALVLCQAAGMVKLGRVALDGTKVRANASRRKAMSYARMSAREKELAEQVSALLADAEAVDAGEDAAYGRERRGDELPPDLRRRQDRLARIRQAKAALEAEAAAAAGEHAAELARRKGADEDTVAERAAQAAAQAVPRPKAQRNFTDPDSRIMKTSDGSFHQCYNAQAVVDEDHQVIVAADLNQCAADVANLIPMSEQATANTGQAPGQVLADAGYCSDHNLDQVTAFTDEHGTDFFIATGRLRHDESVPATPRGRIPKNATPKQRMARKLRTKPGRAAYARRKAIVEPVFGQMSTLANAKHLLLRGLDAARDEWLLLAACHNLRKLHAHTGVQGMAGLATT
jgi:transposase